MSKPVFKLAEMTYEDARAMIELGAVGFLPTGACEAHGPHLPLSTDVIISEAAAERAAFLLHDEGKAAVVLPPIGYGVTEFAQGFGGTISIGAETMRSLVRDVIEGALRAGVRAVVVCNAHLEPENIAAVKAAVEDCAANGARVAFPDVTRKPHALRLGEEFKSGACHAGDYETSLVMAASPFLVRAELASGLAPNPTSLSQAIRAGKKTFLEAGGSRAYFGDPAAGSAAHGDELYRELAAIFATAARELISASR
jgi:creatinine amidohydrolase